MWVVNEADLSAQNASGYVHVVMLHYGLGVGLAVADLLPTPSAADPPNGIEDSYRLCKFSRSVKLQSSLHRDSTLTYYCTVTNNITMICSI
jgi:hypothetical protein